MHQVAVVRNEVFRIDKFCPEFTLTLDSQNESPVRLHCRDCIRGVGRPGLSLTIAGVYTPPGVSEADYDKHEDGRGKHGDASTAEILACGGVPRFQFGFSH